MPFKTPYTDAIGPKSVPTRGTGGGTYDSEPNLPSGMPGRTGGTLPEKTREDITPKTPGWIEPGKDFVWGR